jgi:hypothetical protein
MPSSPDSQHHFPVCDDATHPLSSLGLIPSTQLMVHRRAQGKWRGINLVGKLEVQIMIGIMKRIVPKYICLLLTVTSNSCTSMSVKPYDQSAPKTGENYMH